MGALACKLIGFICMHLGLNSVGYTINSTTWWFFIISYFFLAFEFDFEDDDDDDNSKTT